MKRIAASVGLVALGATALQAADASALSSMQTSKPWSVSLALRGFYDDNINTTKSSQVDSFGFEINPSVGVAFAGTSTSVSARYTYSGKHYDERPAGSDGNWDNTHIFDLNFQHAFSPRAQLSIQDEFVVGQEPDVIRSGDIFSTFQRISGDNFRNYAGITFNYQVTQLLGFEVGYGNTWYDYDDEGNLAVGGGATASGVDTAFNIISSRSGLLDRFEHAVHLDSRWHLAPQTTGILGYMFLEADYIGDEAIQGNVVVGPPFLISDNRNSRSHICYVGAEHSFSPDLSGSLKVGAQYIDFYNDPSGTTDVSPYVVATLAYEYSAESHAQLGVTHSRSASDIVGTVPGDFVRDTEATVVYASVVHRLMPRLFASFIGSFQYSTFNGGGPTIDGQADRIYLFGLDLAYHFNPHLSGHVGYNYDQLDSDISTRDYSRNRAYVGVSAEY